jgi:TolA-binding protein
MTTPQGGQAPQVSAQDVIARLSNKVADLTVQNTILEAQLQALAAFNDGNASEFVQNEQDNFATNENEVPVTPAPDQGQVDAAPVDSAPAPTEGPALVDAAPAPVEAPAAPAPVDAPAAPTATPVVDLAPVAPTAPAAPAEAAPAHAAPTLYTFDGDPSQADASWTHVGNTSDGRALFTFAGDSAGSANGGSAVWHVYNGNTGTPAA